MKHRCTLPRAGKVERQGSWSDGGAVPDEPEELRCLVIGQHGQRGLQHELYKFCQQVKTEMVKGRRG